jgi:hypothetical protein
MEVSYSVDMIRLKTHVNSLFFQEFQNVFLSIEPGVDYWESNKCFNYRHNWRITQNEEYGRDKLNEFSYYLAYRHNMERHSLAYDLVLEYNPNKCHLTGLLYKILKRFFRANYTIVSADVACDFEVPIECLVLDKNGKSLYKYFESRTGKTHYIGEGDGQVTIYDKAGESGLDGVKTRYEVHFNVGCTRELIHCFQFNHELPKVYYLSAFEQITFDDMKEDKTLAALLYAVHHGYSVNELSRVYRKKIKSYFENKEKEIVFDKKKISDCLINYVYQLSEQLNI